MSRCDAAQFVGDITYPDGSLLTRNSTFVKIWKIKNIGTATMSGTLDGTVCAAGGTGCSVPVVVVLHQEGEAWVIDEVTVEGVPF